MTKCYGHEECEYNAQPNCALPNGMECPHRVKADKPAAEGWTDIEALIERLNQYSQSLIAYQMGGEFADVCMDAATALSTLQAENEKLRAEVERQRRSADDRRHLYENAERAYMKVLAELELVQRDFDGLCEYIDSEGFLRKQFCESGNLDLEPCICPSLQEHPGYIDSDDCEGCDHFCNSWRSQKEDEHE